MENLVKSVEPEETWRTSGNLEKKGNLENHRIPEQPGKILRTRGSMENQ